jgi:hypothetical protein
MKEKKAFSSRSLTLKIKKNSFMVLNCESKFYELDKKKYNNALMKNENTIFNTIQRTTSY